MKANESRHAVILDVWAHIEPRFGGVGPAASAMATAVGARGVTAKQIAICDPLESKLADGINENTNKVFHSGTRGLSDIRLGKILRAPVMASDVCHVHGMWLPHCLAVRKLAAEFKKPVVSSVHGMLEQWELKNKQTKKALYSRLFERPSIKTSSCLRALSLLEASDYRRYGAEVPVVVIPNGIEPLEPVDAAPFLSRFPELLGKTIVLFLGRVHHKKGILNLLQAWQAVVAQCSDAHLVVAGPEYEDTGDKARSLIQELNLQDTVTMAGILSGLAKLEALSAARYFCLPSYSEGLSVAVLEALSVGVPPIVTPECNIPEVVSEGAGYCTSNKPTLLAEALIACMQTDSQTWSRNSQAARRLARTTYSWNTVAESMRSVYEWLLGGGDPKCQVL